MPSSRQMACRRKLNVKPHISCEHTTVAHYRGRNNPLRGRGPRFLGISVPFGEREIRWLRPSPTLIRNQSREWGGGEQVTLGSSSRHGTPAGSLAMVHDPPGSWEGEREAQKEARVGQFRLCAPPHNTRLCLLISGRSEIMVSAAGVRESLSGTRLCRARRPNRKGDRHRHRRTMPNDFLLASTSTADRSSRTWTGSRSALPISRRGPDCPPPARRGMLVPTGRVVVSGIVHGDAYFPWGVLPLCHWLR